MDDHHIIIEKGVSKEPSQRRELVSPQCCILSGLFALTLTIALVAVSLSVLVYVQLLETKALLDQQREEESVVHMVQLDPEQDLAILKELEAMFEGENLMHFNHFSRQPIQTRRSSQSSREEILNAGCNSTATDVNEKPLAHVVAGDRMYIAIPDDSKPHSIITKDWVCGRPDKTQTSSTYGRVRGGMFFNRSSGFLRLPKTGVYYVYSLVHFRGGSVRETKAEQPIQSKMVACIPDLECEFPEDQYISYLHAERRLFNATRYDEENNFQAGLFHFPAETQLAIVVNNPKYKQTYEHNQGPDNIYLDGRRQHTYMGAYLVDDD